MMDDADLKFGEDVWENVEGLLGEQQRRLNAALDSYFGQPVSEMETADPYER